MLDFHLWDQIKLNQIFSQDWFDSILDWSDRIFIQSDWPQDKSLIPRISPVKNPRTNLIDSRTGPMINGFL